jgi:hypothetical protein
VQSIAKLLQPIWEALKREVLESSLSQADETPVVVLNKEGTKKGYLWTYGIPWEEVVFDFSEGRGRRRFSLSSGLACGSRSIPPSICARQSSK